MNAIFIFIVTAILSNLISCERLHKQIYSTIEGGAACFRRLNGTNQVGCSSSDKGAVGVVNMIYNISDAQWMVHNASEGPYMAVVTTSLFYDVVEFFMEYPQNVAGVLLYDSTIIRASEFSQESRCPNEYSSGPGSQCTSSIAGTVVWNERGTGLMRRDIPFPIFYLPESRFEEIDKIERCYKMYNLDRENQKGKPLCSIQLHSFMFAAVNSIVCMRRSASTAILTPTKVCDPLGDQNVFTSLFPRVKETSTTKKPVTLVTARIDSASLFDGVSPGVASSVVGLVTLITAAATLSKMIPSGDAKKYDHNILWTLLNGEAFDYIGSQRVAYDMAHGAWPPGAPLAPADVRLHLELGQLGGDLANHAGDTSWPLRAFAANNINAVPQISEFLQEFSNNFEIYNITLQTKFTENLPPSSLHSFRRILKNETESGQLPEILLVDHGETFTNMFYQSVLDDYHHIGFVYHNISIENNGSFISTNDLVGNGTMKETEAQVKISKLATAVARTLYQRVTGKPYPGDISASAHLVDEMLCCFTGSQGCQLLQAAVYSSGDDGPPPRAAPLYVGVAAYNNSPAAYVAYILALLTGEHLAENRTDCEQLNDVDYNYMWLRGWNHSGVCIKTTVNYSLALSPAFTISGYDFTSGQYSTWTESVWQSMWARVFVSAAGYGARIAVSAGAIVTIAAALITYWLKRHCDLLFVDRSAPMNNEVATGEFLSLQKANSRCFFYRWPSDITRAPPTTYIFYSFKTEIEVLVPAKNTRKEASK